MLIILGIIIVSFFICIVLLKDNIIALITAFGTVISAIIVIPTKKQINEVIKNIQDYDKAVREDLAKK